MSRPEIPDSYVVDLNDVVKRVYEEIRLAGFPIDQYGGMDIDIVIPVYDSLNEEVAKHAVWILGNKMYSSTKSRYVEYMEHKNKADTFYIYDRFKSTGFSHKNSYKQFTYEVPYHEKGKESIYIPVYWRVN